MGVFIKVYNQLFNTGTQWYSLIAVPALCNGVKLGNLGKSGLS